MGDFLIGPFRWRNWPLNVLKNMYFMHARSGMEIPLFAFRKKLFKWTVRKHMDDPGRTCRMITKNFRSNTIRFLGIYLKDIVYVTEVNTDGCQKFRNRGALYRVHESLRQWLQFFFTKARTIAWATSTIIWMCANWFIYWR